MAPLPSLSPVARSLTVSAPPSNGLAAVPFAPVGVEFFFPKPRHADASRNREERRGRCGGATFPVKVMFFPLF